MSARLPSNRSFGALFTAFFTLVGTLSLWRGSDPHPWLFALAGLTAAVTLLRPAWLAPLNAAWMKLGEALNRVVSPVVLGAIFFAVFTPVGAILRLAGRDAMKRRFEPGAPTYWIRRDPPGPPGESFTDPF